VAAKNDFEKRYFDQIDGGFKDIKEDIKEVRDELHANTTETRRISSRVTKLETRVFPGVPETMQKLPPFWRDPQIIKLFTYVTVAVVILLAIFAGLSGISLPKGFP
jgi:uncharacterized membrane protein